MRYLIVVLALLETKLWPQTALPSDVLIDKAHPSVYVIRAVARPESREENGAWLELHNNTKWTISIRTASLYIGDKVKPLTLRSGKGVLGMRTGTVIAPCYTVEAVASGSPNTVSNEPYQRLKLGAACTVGSTSWLPSGADVLMRIPEDHLSAGRRISIDFQYEWEAIPNVEHRVFFAQPQEIQKSRQ